MSLLCYLKPVNSLPTVEQAGLPASITLEVNKAVQEALDRAPSNKKQKYTTLYNAEDRATIGLYAAENDNTAAVKKFTATHQIEESTTRVFIKKYLEEF